MNKGFCEECNSLVEYEVKEIRNVNDYKTIYHLKKVNSEFK
jgi:DNA-directed RNA polymerase subunit M/transcription elongation factor TFIIS